MGEHVIKLPDIGEGVAEAELTEWEVAVGDEVREDQVLAAVMTDKATVEIPAPRDGKILWLGPAIGDVVAVGSAIIRMEVAGEGNVAPGEALPEPEPAPQPEPAPKPLAPEAAPAPVAPAPAPEPALTPAFAEEDLRPASAEIGLPRPPGEAPLASPAVRRRAMEGGIDLRRVPGTGPAGRIVHDDLDAFIATGGLPVGAPGTAKVRNTGVEEIRVVGLRRKIAEKMATSKSRIPHITYVDEVDMTALEDLRAKLNADRATEQPKLTLIPFLMRAMARAIADQPEVNALFDDDAGIIRQHGAINIGVAAQTEKGLVVPVVRHVEALGLWDCARELARLAEAAREGRASREDLTGATITITSLGALGGIVTTPVINHPEVAIIGVNKLAVRPVWQESAFVPRKMMNLSSSFDHRVIDGWNAAVFIQRIKDLLEAPATIFIDE
ncbi:MAG: dihydrolipoamide acetyltransferase family protein [Pseudomonadota bacterium]